MSGNGGSTPTADALLPMEIEPFVEALQPSTFEELGSLGWLDKHTRVEKLTLQAVLEAMSENREEVVKEMLISHEKLPVLVHDLIMVELWREQIFPKLLEKEPKSTFTLYTILYHEATCLNLIETILFHQDSSETLGEAALDLSDYCFRSLNWLMTNIVENEDASEESNSNSADLRKQLSTMLFQIAIKCLTCIRYLIENLDRVAPGVLPRLIITTDTPMLLTQILIQKPWQKLNKNGDLVNYNCEEQRWVELEGCQRLLIGKIEVQAWLALYQLFMHSRVISSYEIHEHRRGQLLKLRSMLNEVTLDQIPFLGEFQRWLNEVSMGSSPGGPTKSPLFIEMLPPIRTALEAYLEKTGKSIFRQHCKELLENSQNAMTQKAKKLANAYDFEAFESVLPPSKCAGCGEPALKKCGRCHCVYYCKRECQVDHWPKHKEFCDKIIAQ